jgi:archaemetzincin
LSKVTKFAVVALVLGICARFLIAPSLSAEEQKVARLKRLTDRLAPLHKPLGKPQPGDWLLSHHEPGQTFAQYVQELPITATGERKVIYVQPLGEFTATQNKVVALTAQFMHRYFALQVKMRSPLPLSVVPESARRKVEPDADEQILTTFVLESILEAQLPSDAAAMIAFTAADLWPGEGWNFVYGQASDRVGVWSLNRNGDPDLSEADFRLCLSRTMKTAVHETGHMFSMRHCTKYECCMCGGNNREETDRRPIEVCPECLAKLCWATDCDPEKRFRQLADFCNQQGLVADHRFYEQSLAVLTGRAARTP